MNANINNYFSNSIEGFKVVPGCVKLKQGNGVSGDDIACQTR